MNIVRINTLHVDKRDRGGPNQPLFIANRLNKRFPLRGTSKQVHAVNDVSFNILKGETLGVVGESGCGKSTLGRLLLQLIEPSSGEVIFDGESVGHDISIRDLRRQVQMVFQDSFGSLNPRLSILDSVAFGPVAHGSTKSDALMIARDALRSVDLNHEEFGHRYPHELSGGQKQRANIARSLALRPRMLVLDESVSALDKTVAAKVIRLLERLKRELSLTYMFISHDLDVVRHLSDRVMVMYLGRVVEIGTVEDIFDHPMHPYSRGLLQARPTSDPRQRTLKAPIDGEPPDPVDPPGGCAFHPRCAHAEAACRSAVPMLTEGPHQVACVMYVANSGHSRAPRESMKPAPVVEAA
ncbi:peptide/nickel transport system ATP-binding protein [Variovorax sp. YR266]|uniref:oligopeptide/dipeptide ABC transporter ATP-binding protein n=1 Tax=Variovorax sp. YR266 TaxID=1884386 RepID=UPI0008992838|nr:oligopeptide/dipeptide ABC transporter ATP-binding protein [Variovorax sp. YR266]SDY33580.1 peptide/nickel transport system ATP-binding protein [Variovorax sp. YR266]